MNDVHRRNTAQRPGALPHAMGPVRAGWILAGLTLLAAGCGDPPKGQGIGPTPDETTPAAPADYPEDTAFAFNGIPVLKAEIDKYLPLIRMIDPHEVDSSLRRKALTNIVLPVVAGQSILPEEREAAFQLAQAQVSEVRETGQLAPGSPEARYLTGTWREVGLVPFQAAVAMEVGSYSTLLETPGSFTYFQLIATNAGDALFGPLTEITIQRYDVPYVPTEAGVDLIQSTIDSIPVEIVDEEWEHIVPPILLYKPAPAR